MNDTETRLCRRREQEYDSQYYHVMGLHLLRGDGYCPTCAQQVYEEEVAREEMARQAEVARIRRERREGSGIPPKFMNEDFSTFEKGWQDKAFKLCWDYAESYPIDRYPREYHSLYLWSTESWGTGKTHMASAVCHRIYDRWDGLGNKGCPQESRAPMSPNSGPRPGNYNFPLGQQGAQALSQSLGLTGGGGMQHA